MRVNLPSAPARRRRRAPLPPRAPASGDSARGQAVPRRAEPCGTRRGLPTGDIGRGWTCGKSAAPVPTLVTRLQPALGDRPRLTVKTLKTIWKPLSWTPEERLKHTKTVDNIEKRTRAPEARCGPWPKRLELRHEATRPQLLGISSSRRTFQSSVVSRVASASARNSFSLA